MGGRGGGRGSVCVSSWESGFLGGHSPQSFFYNYSKKEPLDPGWRICFRFSLLSRRASGLQVCGLRFMEKIYVPMHPKKRGGGRKIVRGGSPPPLTPRLASPRFMPPPATPCQLTLLQPPPRGEMSGGEEKRGKKLRYIGLGCTFISPLGFSFKSS